jgi:putative DNA primase/helicase
MRERRTNRKMPMPINAKRRGEREKRQQDRGQSPKPPVLLPPPSQPMQVAREFVRQCLLYNGAANELTLRYWHGGWWTWRSSHWGEVEKRAVLSLLYRFTEHAAYVDGGDFKPWAPNRRKIGDLLEALGAIVILSDQIDQPCWLDQRTTGTIVAIDNRLLDITTRRLHDHTPLYFNVTAVPFAYDPAARAPQRWHAFLDELWPNEAAAIDVLGEWFGYVISGRLDLHKILLMVGPTRGGKGVIARTLSELIGKKNVAGPTLNSLGGDFGLAPLIGKSLAVISDARFVGKNSNVVVERLLSISGEDALTVNIKYKEQWTGKLPCRLHVISNELPKLGDASQAIIGRIVLLPLSRSWLGQEDHGLERGLHAELPGILNWALDGLERLQLADRFTPLGSADDMITTMRDLASPVAAFVREMCVVDVSKEIDVDELYSAYKPWAEENGHPRPSKSVFGRDLRAAVPSIDRTRPRDGSTRHYVYAGLALRDAGDSSEEPR